MQVWNVLHAACWKCRTQKIAKNWPFGHHRTTLSGYIFAIKACYRQSEKKLVKQQYVPHMSSQYGELWPTNGWDLLVSWSLTSLFSTNMAISETGWDLFGSLGNPSKFQQVSRLGSDTARHSSSGRQPNFVALNRERQLYSAGSPSRWALAHILVMVALCNRADHNIFIL